MSDHQEIQDVPAELWVIASKIRGIGELFNVFSADPPLSDHGSKGVAYLLITLADDIEVVKNFIEDNASKDKE